jgi:hypothetical protein
MECSRSFDIAVLPPSNQNMSRGLGNGSNVLTLIVFRLYTVLSILMKVCTIPCHDRGHINVVVVLQSCTDLLQVLRGSSSETFPTSSDSTYVSNRKVEEDVNMQELEEVNVKTEKVIFCEEEECTGIKDEKAYILKRKKRRT